MLLYLKYDQYVECVKDISLKSGFIPVIGDSSLLNPGSSEPLQLDPSLWYKTLVVNAVYIDCDEREVKWTRLADSEKEGVKSPSKEEFFPDHAEQLHINNDLYDFDPTKDEFLDSANAVMERYTAKTSKRISQEQFKVDVVRLLHCYILPLLQFYQVDVPALEDVLTYIENQHEQMEMRLLKKTEELQRTENYLQKQRERILLNEQFDSEKYVWSCKRDFLAVFLSHIEKDINNVNLEFDQLSEHITCLKKAAKENPSEEFEKALVMHRETRDKVYNWLVKVQTVRETIKNIYRPIKTKKNKYKKIKIKDNVIHNIYYEIDNRLRQQKDDIQSLIMKKVRMSSVREAVYGVLCSLRRNKGSTSPLETADGSEYSLEIIGLQSKPADWDTLEEKVTHQLADPASEIYTEHLLGCQRICYLVQACITETTLFGCQTQTVENTWELLPSTPMCSVVNPLCRLSTEKCENLLQSGRLSSPCDSKLDHLSASNVKLALKNIKECFIVHMDKMCNMLMKSIQGCTQHQNKIWVLYETIFSPKCLPDLLNLYKLSNMSTVHRVHKMISTLSVSEIMNDDQRFLKLLHTVLHVNNSYLPNNEHTKLADSLSPCAAAGRPASNASALSIEIKKCTLEELYSMADKDSSVLEQQFAFEMSDLTDDVGVSPSSSCTNLTSSSEETDTEDGGTASLATVSVTLTEEDHKTMLSDMLASTIGLLRKFLDATTVMDKLRKLTQVYRDVGAILTGLMEDKGMVCCDEMLSMMIILLWCLDVDTFLSVYINMKLLIDLMPDFLVGHVHDCSLTNFQAAYQMLFDSECLHRKSACRQ